MADTQKALAVRPAEWSDEIAALLERSAHDPLVGVRQLRDLVQANRGVLFEITADDRLVGAYVLQKNCCENGSELVIVAAAADWPGHAVAPAMLPWFEELAQRAGCARVRFTAGRRGMVRVASRAGYRPLGTVVIKDVRHVL